MLSLKEAFQLKYLVNMSEMYLTLLYTPHG